RDGRVNRLYLVRKTCVSYFETPSRTIPLQAEGLVPVIEIIKNEFSDFAFLRGCHLFSFAQSNQVPSKGFALSTLLSASKARPGASHHRTLIP
ncbi:MAG: hypothetical protein KAJ60_09870, partial [Desulfobulbaceae bacterium]|nr:hypothetical protein [Desulfobulbaceae bacterium]